MTPNTSPTRLSKWGIRIVAAWAGLLALITLANLLLLSASADIYESLGEVWWVFIINVLFIIGFGVSAYGLWQQQNWGRRLFLGTMVVWALFNLLALFAPAFIFVSERAYAPQNLFFSVVRLVAGLIFSFGYLNLPNVKAAFLMPNNQPSEKEDKK